MIIEILFWVGLAIVITIAIRSATDENRWP